MADVVVTTTIRDPYVARLTTMVQDKYMRPGSKACEGLTLKQCFIKKMIVEPIKRELLEYEKRVAVDVAVEEAEAGITEIEVEGE